MDEKETRKNKELEDKRRQAERLALDYLARANIALEAGKDASTYEAKAQYWLDRLNHLEGLVD